MEMTPRREALIEAHVAESRRLMLDAAFELNDLVRFAIAASKQKGHKVYYPMDPVNDGIRNWVTLSKKLAKLARDVEQTSQRLGVQPFDPEQPARDDPVG
ncbi:MAG: hypothetical protein H7Y61_06500 [Rhizobiales bacterium]|nr:hypothetical protein [Rhizobacter sp.]